jgi:hypothetical protein
MQLYPYDKQKWYTIRTMSEGFSPEEKRAPNAVSKIIKINFIILFLFLVAIAFVLYRFYTEDKPWRLFPLDDRYAEYRIVKDGNKFGVLHRKSGDSFDNFVVLVGTSVVDLKPYVGARAHITGNWGKSNSTVVINIKKITKAE